MKLNSVNLYHIGLELKTPFITHAGIVTEREAIIVEIIDENGIRGYGECVPFSTPFYTPETVNTVWIMLSEILLPLLKNQAAVTPKEYIQLFKGLKGWNMAKAGIEGALWDVYAKEHQMSLSQCIGGTKSTVETGVVISLGENVKEKLQEYTEKGYKRFKLKVDKGREREQLEEFFSYSPNASVMFDGNGVYQREDIEHLVSLDDLNLQMIEQPFSTDDFYLHHLLQEQMNTPICLDESIESYHDAYQAIEMKSCSTINLKIGRVGGLTESIYIHNLALKKKFPLWVGGMLETGIGRSHNIALASMPMFTIPGDISESSRYWERDIVYPEITVQNGEVKVPTGPGIGVNVDMELINFHTKRTYQISLS